MKSLLLILSILIITACGQRPASRIAGGGAYLQRNPATGSATGASDLFSYSLGATNSGSTGSPSQSGTIQSSSGGTASLTAAASPNAQYDFWGNSIVSSATTPQQCADNYMRQPQEPSNFQRLFAELAGCLNRVMLIQNPYLNQGYQALQQNPYQASVSW